MTYTTEARTTGYGDVNVAYDPHGWFPWNHHGVAYEATNVPCGFVPQLEADEWMSNTLAIGRTAAADYVSEFGQPSNAQDIFLIKNSDLARFDFNNNITIGDRRFNPFSYYYLVAHEYGHAYHYRALGGMPRGKCVSPHYFDGADNHKCAYTEGFASFAAAVTVSLSYGDYYGLSATSDYNYNRVVVNGGYPGDPSHARSGRESYSDDGSVIEGAFAAFMWDLYDPAGSPGEGGESFDQTSYPLTYVADVMRSCQYVVDGTSRPEDGTDRLITCFQRQRVPHGPSFFRLRYDYGDHVYSFTESAVEPTGWNRSNIVNLWRNTFYGLGPTPLDVEISGPSEVVRGASGTWTANVVGTTGSVAYSWCFKNANGSGVGSRGGDPAPTTGEWHCGNPGQTLTATMYAGVSQIDLRVTATASNGAATDTHVAFPVSGGA